MRVGPRALRGGGHRRGRRLRPDEGTAGGHLAPSGARTRERDRQPAQRPPGPDTAGERGGRPRHLSPAPRPAPDLRHREPGPTGLVVVPVVVLARGAGRRHGGRRRSPPTDLPVAWPPWSLPADVSWTEVSEAGGRGDGPGDRAGSGVGDGRCGGGGGQSPAVGRAGDHPFGRRRHPPGRADGRQPGGGHDGGRRFCARRSRPDSNGGPGYRPSTGWVTWPSSPRPN